MKHFFSLADGLKTFANQAKAGNVYATSNIIGNSYYRVVIIAPFKCKTSSVSPPITPSHCATPSKLEPIDKLTQQKNFFGI